jgi:predicted dehydrogenase
MNSAKPSLSRRDFLRHSTASAAGLGLSLAMPNVLTRPAFGAEARKSAGEGIRLGVIGVGGQGKSHLGTPSVTPGLFALCDVDKNRLAEAKAQVEKKVGRTVATYGDYRQMLESKEIDAVIVATPDHWHALQAIHACQAGKDVYVEKPLTLTVHEGWAMIKAARQHHRIVQTGSQQRSWVDGKFRRACEYVRSGRIGDVKTIRVGLPGVNWTKEALVPDSEPPPELNYDLWLGPAPWRPYNKHRVHYYFRFFWDYSGGQMTNWGAHHLDIAQWALDMDQSGPVAVEARAEYDPQKRYEVPDWFEITYRYAKGVRILCGQSHRGGTTFEGTDGLIYVDRGRLECTVKGVLEEPLGQDDVRLPESRNHHENWFESIKSRKPPICDVAIGHRSAVVCHLGNIAVRLGRAIKWDPVKEQILGDEDATRRLSYAYRAPWSLPAA